MTRSDPSRPSRGAPRVLAPLARVLGPWTYAAASITGVGLVAAGTIVLIMARADRILRADLLRQVRTAAFALDTGLVASLRGVEADTASPTYLALKNRLARIRAADPRCRFAYLMDQTRGAVVFLVDSEPPGSPDESPAGQIYTEASAELLEVFATGRESVAGPWHDRWGTWVSGFVPLRLDGRVVVLGMDIDGHGWRRLVVASGALPALLVVLACGLVLSLLRLRRVAARSQERQHKIEGILRGSPIGIGVAEDRVFVEVNERFCELAGLPRDRLLGQSTRILYPDDAEFERVGRELYGPLHRGEVGTVEALVRRADGTVRDALISAAAVERDRPTSIAFAVVDVTELRRTEEALRAALREKEVLLREVHHRVKNNLQAVVALIQMRADALADEAAVRAMEELQEQVRAMAFVYEQVYRAGGVGDVAMDSYLSTIVNGLMDAMGDGTVRVDVSADAVTLPIGQAMACGLIVTELVTNALKHAFLPGKGGHVEVGFACEARRRRLWVADDGAGWRPGTGFDSPSASGLQMVKLWATHQLGGTVEASGPPGARVAIEFPHGVAAGSVRASPSVCASA